MQYFVSTVFRGVDMMTGTMKKMAASSTTFAGSIEKNFRGVGVRMERLNSAIRGTIASGVAWGAAIGIPMVSILKTGAEFEDTLIRAFAKLDEQVDFGSRRFGELKRSIIDVTRGTEFTGTQSAQAFRELAGAGYDAAKALSAMPEVFKLSRASEMDLNETAVRSVDLLKAFNLESADAEKNRKALARAGNMMAVADAKSTSNMRQLFEVIQNSSPAVTRAKGDLETVLALAANLGDIKGFEAGTGIKQLYSRLVPTEKLKRQLLEDVLKVSMKDKNGGIKDMVTVLEEMDVALRKLTPYGRMKALKQIFGEEGIAPAKMAEAFATMPGKIRQTREEIRSMTGQLDRLDTEIKKGFKFQWGEAVSNFEKVKLSLYDKLKPAAIVALTRLTTWLNSRETQDKLANALVRFADKIPMLVDGLLYIADNFETIAATLISLRLGELLFKLGAGLFGLYDLLSDVGAFTAIKGGFGYAFAGASAGAMVNPVMAIALLTTAIYALIQNIDALKNFFDGMGAAIGTAIYEAIHGRPEQGPLGLHRRGAYPDDLNRMDPTLYQDRAASTVVVSPHRQIDKVDANVGLKIFTDVPGLKATSVDIPQGSPLLLPSSGR